MSGWGLVRAVKGGRSPAQRTLDGDHRTRQSGLAECRHGAAFSNGSKSPLMQNHLFEAALGIGKPWYVRGVAFDAARKVLTVGIDFVAGSRFAAPGVAGVHPVHDTQTKRLRHLNFFQHECNLEVRTPRVKLPDGRVVQIEPDWFGKLSGFTLLFEALVLALAQQMPFAAVARLVKESWHRVHAICSRYVDLAVAEADLSRVVAVAVDETSCRRGHDYLTIAADADERKVVFMTEGRDAATIARFAEHLPRARITFDKFHVVAHASAALDQTRRLEQRADASLKGLRWTLLKDRQRLSAAARADLDALVSQAATKRTARAWLYREGLRAILDRKQINVVVAMLRQWCTNVLRSKVAPMKEVARMIRRHFDGIVAWTQTRQTNGFIEALNGLFQAAKRKARGYTRFATMRTVLFLIAGKLDFTRLNPDAA